MGRGAVNTLRPCPKRPFHCHQHVTFYCGFDLTKAHFSHILTSSLGTIHSEAGPRSCISPKYFEFCSLSWGNQCSAPSGRASIRRTDRALNIDSSHFHRDNKSFDMILFITDQFSSPTPKKIIIKEYFHSVCRIFFGAPQFLSALPLASLFARTSARATRPMWRVGTCGCDSMDGLRGFPAGS